MRKKKLLAALGFAWGALSLIVGPAAAVTGSGSGSISVTSTTGGQATAASATAGSTATASPGSASASETTCDSVAIGINGASDSVGGCDTHVAP